MENELLEENKRLKEQVAELQSLLRRKSSSNSRAYDEIRNMVMTKTNKEVEVDIVNGIKRNWTRKRAEKQIMSDLKWDLRVRTIKDFTGEHIEMAREYLNNYVIPEDLKKSRWKEV